MAKRKQEAYDRARVPIRRGPDFTDLHIQALLDLGLLPDEIDELRRCLYSLEVKLRPAPSIGPIRAYLAVADKALQQAEQVLEPLSNPLGQRSTWKEMASTPSADERVALRVRDMVLNASPDPEILDRIIPALEILRTAIADAMDGLPTQQRQRVNIAAIRHIHNAWLRGHGKHVWDDDGHLRHGKQPPFLGVVTRAYDAPFPQVAEFCFEAVGSNANVDGAIRAYLQARAKRTREDRKFLGFPSEHYEHVGKPGRPRGKSSKGLRKSD